METKHTPTPWRLYRRRTATKIVENDNFGNVLEGMNSRENYEHIVKCVNSHDKLIEALRSAVDALECFGCEDVPYYDNLLKEVE